MNIVAATLALRSALLNARKRTGDSSLATSVNLGYFRAERVIYRPDGAGIVHPLTGWTSADAVVAHLNAL